MPQDFFDICAVTTARLKVNDKVSIEDFIHQVCDNYRRDYIDDGYEQDLVIATNNVIQTIESFFPKDQISSALRQMQYCIKYFKTNGKKRFFLQGQIFHRQKVPLDDRIGQCTSDILCYHFGTINGHFPLAPKEWTL